MKAIQNNRYAAKFTLTEYGIIKGYAYDSLDVGKTITLEIYCDGALITLAQADKERPLTPNNLMFHGFVFEIYQKWLTKKRIFSVKIANTNILFPVETDEYYLSDKIQNHNDNSYDSQVLYNQGGIVRGWVKKSIENISNHKIKIYCDNNYLTSVSANEKIQWTHVFKDHLLGFRYEIPFKYQDGNIHIFSFIDDANRELNGSPIELCLKTESLSDNLNHFIKTIPELKVESKTKFRSFAKLYDTQAKKCIGFQYYNEWRSLRKLPTQEILNHTKILFLRFDQPSAIARHHLLEQNQITFDKKIITDSIIVSDDNFYRMLKNIYMNYDYVFPIWNGSNFYPGAVEIFIAEMFKQNALIAYSDIDHTSSTGIKTHPWFKTAWDENIFLSLDYLSSSMCLSKRILELIYSKSNNARDELNKKFLWHDFLLKAVWKAEDRILHIPHVLSSRPIETYENIISENTSRLKAIKKHLKDRYYNQELRISKNNYGLLRIIWPLPKRRPKVTVIIPTRDSFDLIKNCVEGLLNKTNYPSMEIIIIDNQSTDPETIEYFAEVKNLGIRVFSYPYPFNYSDMHNQAIKKATGSLICFLNNDISIIDPDWLDELVRQLSREKVGIVGAKLLWPNYMVQHGGVVVGIDELAAHTGNYLSENDSGYYFSNVIVREQSAVTAACMLIRKQDFIKLGGFDSNLFPIAFNDVDLCMRATQMSLRVIWTPFSKLFHLESASRGKDVSSSQRVRSRREELNFIRKWTSCGWSDPFYNPNLSQDYLVGPFGGINMMSVTQMSRYPR